MMKTKNQKPIEIDAHLKYRCPKCGNDNWISLKEAQVKNYKIVCFCDFVYSPKRIKLITITYKKKPQKKETITLDLNAKDKNSTLDLSILNKAIKILKNYGFSDVESKTFVLEAYNRIHSTNIGDLVKNVLLEKKNYE